MTETSPEISADVPEPRKRSVRPKTLARTRTILETAHDVFAERGYEGASISEIARRVGIAEGTIYKHFDSKKDLLAQVLVRYYNGLIAEIEANLPHITGFHEKLRYIFGFHLQNLLTNAGISKVFLREARSHDDYFESIILDLNRRYTGITQAIVQDAITRGEVRADFPVRLVRYLVFGTLEHVAWRAMSGRGRIDVPAIADALTDALVRGMAPPAATGPEPASGLLDRLEAAIARIEAQAAHK